MFTKILFQVIVSFFATVSFSLLFNVPKKELVYCGISGSMGWFFYTLIINFMGNDQVIVANFIGAIVVVSCSRVLAIARKTPLSVYLISGIIPLVPGAGIYYTMFSMVNNENTQALAKGILTLKTAGVIAISIVIVLSLPSKMFINPFKSRN